MNNKVKNIVVTSVFITFIAFFVMMCIYSFFNPVEKSTSERRPLAQFPDEITWGGIVDKTVINEFEDYSVDQFPFREFFRGIKARFQLHVLNLKENNGLAVEDGYIVKIEQDFDDKIVDSQIGKLQNYYDKFVKDNGGDHYIALIPDKNYFLGKDHGYPSPDYGSLTDKVTSALPSMEYIDIYGELELDDYYRTDTHWSQDKIGRVVDKIATAMGFADRLSGKYTENRLEGFKGVYYGQSALMPKPDTLVYLTNDTLDSCVCTIYNSDTKNGKKLEEIVPIYNLEKFKGNDGYELFLSGSVPLIKIDNPNATTDETLVVFRDSYGSSITPMFAEAYKTVYIVDIRYIDAKMLSFYGMINKIDFEGADVLFLYSALVLNSNSFK